MRHRPWAAAAISVMVYAGLTATMWRDVLAHLSTVIAHDAGDPIFTATLLYWNATQTPLTDAWWQLPTFYPLRDTLAFSEHLLGLSVISTPLHGLTRDALTTYNLTAFLTFPLCGLAMYALVWWVTGSSIGAFIAGLTYAFTPYRAAQLPHIQMLAAFWAPLVLLGLHAYVDTGRRRWLALYACAWLLQVTTSGYTLVFLSLLVGLWMLWFVVARARWRALAEITAATAAAALPLVPIVYMYLTVHARHGFSRTLDEMREFSADIAAVLCAPATSAFWGWLRVHCRAEGDIFPGLGVSALAVAGLVIVLTTEDRAAPERRPEVTAARRTLAFVQRGLLIVAALYGAITLSVLLGGGWQLDLGLLRVSATSAVKPFVTFLAASIAALFFSPGVRVAARRSSTLGFYLIAVLVTWMLALGPTITFMGRRLSAAGPFAAIAALPGVEGLRVPARFWLMTVLCLSVVGGIVAARTIAMRSRRTALALLAIVSAIIVVDGWMRVPAAPAPPVLGDLNSMRGTVVLEAPTGAEGRDAAAQFRGVLGGWTTVNGYSGYIPSHYPALDDSLQFGDPAAFRVFRDRTDLYVVVPHGNAMLNDLALAQPDASTVESPAWATVYRLPRRPLGPPAHVSGQRLTIAAVQSRCSIEPPANITDGNPHSRWRCEPDGDQHHLLVDLGRVAAPAALVYSLGSYSWEYPRRLLIETSEDAATWTEAWAGSVMEPVLLGALANPRELSFTLPLPPRAARYLRFRHTGFEDAHGWSITELEVWGR